jgi:hypothetical protein
MDEITARLQAEPLQRRRAMIDRRHAMALGAGAWTAGWAGAALGAETLHPSLAPLAGLLGSWRGDGEGEPGVSRVERSYRPALGGRFIMATNRSTYAPQPKNPKGEVHDDVGYLSLDRARKLIVFRQFHVEGYVNQYVAQPPAGPLATLVFESEGIENIPAGFRARETYRLLAPDAFEEVFELAEPGKAFAVYSTNRLKRV